MAEPAIHCPECGTLVQETDEGLQPISRAMLVAYAQRATKIIGIYRGALVHIADSESGNWGVGAREALRKVDKL